MKWYKYIWGILLIGAIVLAVRAFQVLGPLKEKATAAIGEACVINAARSVSQVIDYAAEHGEEELLEETAYYLLGAKGLFPEFPEAVSRVVSELPSSVELYANTGTEVKDADNGSILSGANGDAEGTVQGAGDEWLESGRTDSALDASGVESVGSLFVEYAKGGVEPVFAAHTYPDWREQIQSLYPVSKMQDASYLIKNYYIVDSSTSAAAEEFDIEKLLGEDLTISEPNGEPQILIYHTHASEGYIDSREGNYEDTVMGVGAYLTEILTSRYGYEVYHDTNIYDRKDGKDNRNYAYSTAIPYITQILAENPSIEVVIDLHRDGGKKRVTEIDGENVAQIMLFNGLCRNENGPIADLANPYLEENLAFSLRMNLVGGAMYPGLMYKIYLKNYRYNMHVCPKSLLVELGTNQNTLEEAMNAMPYFASVLDQVLQSK